MHILNLTWTNLVIENQQATIYQEKTKEKTY